VNSKPKKDNMPIKEKKTFIQSKPKHKENLPQRPSKSKLRERKLNRNFIKINVAKKNFA